MMDYEKLLKGAGSCVKNFVNVTNEDKVLIITDKSIIAEALSKASHDDVGAEVTVIYLPNSREPMKELSDTLKSVIKNYTVIFTPFDPKPGEILFLKGVLALTNEDGERKIAHMPSVTPNMFIDGMLSLDSVEMEEMRELTEKLACLLSATKKIIIQSAGHDETNLTLELESWSHSGVVSTGHIMKGSWGNLPSGEAFVLPKRGSASGVIVVDKAIMDYPHTDIPATMHIDRGMIDFDSIKGGKVLKKDLMKLSEMYGDTVRTVCEFGIGTNPKPSFTPVDIEIEKILGTVHIAIGNNIWFGGDIEAPVHIDMVVNEPNVTVYNLYSDPVCIMEGGKIMKDRIWSFFNVHYTSFTEELSPSAIIRVKEGITVTSKEGMLNRYWSDHRQNELSTAVGDRETARKLWEFWEKCIPKKKVENVGNIIGKYRKNFKEDSKIACQMLNTLEKFGIIEIIKRRG